MNFLRSLFRQKPIIILPVEVYAREIDHKLLLASYLSKHLDCIVLIAERSLANKIAQKIGQSCIYIGKNFFVTSGSLDLDTAYSVDNHQLKLLLEAKCHIIYSDEEGGLMLAGDFSPLDKHLVRIRMPLNHGEFITNHQNLVLCHWGAYQCEIAQSLFPQYKHVAAGSQHADAAKIYSNYKNSLEAERSLIGLTSSSVFLGDWASQNLPTYLRLAKWISIAGAQEVTQGILHEVALPDVAIKLHESGHKIIYRPHPSSAGFIIGDWIRYCRHRSIRISLPSETTALEYQAMLSINIHTGCSTSLTSYLLNQPTILFQGNCKSKWSTSSILQEAHAENYSELLPFVQKPIVPKPTVLCEKLVLGVLDKELTSFPKIYNEVLEFWDKAKPLRFSAIFAIFIILKRRDISRHLRLLIKNVLLIKQTHMSLKYRRLQKRDIIRNINIANNIWPNSQTSAKLISADLSIIYRHK